MYVCRIVCVYMAAPRFLLAAAGPLFAAAWTAPSLRHAAGLGPRAGLPIAAAPTPYSQVAHEAEELVELVENSRELFLRRQSTLGEIAEDGEAAAPALDPMPPTPPVVTPSSLSESRRAPRKRMFSTPRPSFLRRKSKAAAQPRQAQALSNSYPPNYLRNSTL